MMYTLKEIFINIAGLHLRNCSTEKEWTENVLGAEEIEIFTEHINCTTLYVTADSLKTNLCFSITSNGSVKKFVIFTKIKPCIVSEKNFSEQVHTTFIPGLPIFCLYQCLNYVYMPLTKDVNVEVFKKLEELEIYLRLVVNSETDDSLIKTSADMPLTDNSLEIEAEYWNILSTFKKHIIPKLDCEQFRDTLLQLASDFSLIEVLSLSDAEGLLEKSYNCLDDLWKSDVFYPIDRIKRLMDIVGFFIWKYAHKNLKEIDIWNSDYSMVSEIIQQDISLGEKWLINCKQLTEIFWTNYNKKLWKDGIYQPTNLILFLDTLNEILDIRTMHMQLTKLLTEEEQDDVKTNQMFQAFKEIDILSYGPENHNNLRKIQIVFENVIQPTEEKVALKLKKQFIDVFEDTRELLYKFSLYSELVKRPVLKAKLRSERLKLFTALHAYLAQLQSHSVPEVITIPRCQEISEVMKEIMKIRLLEKRAEDVQKIAVKLLDDLPNYDNLEVMLKELITDLKHQDNKLFDDWCEDVLVSIKNKGLSLRESDPVVQFSDNNLMKVTFSPRLTILLIEVRQLLSMGYRIPHPITDVVTHARKFLRYAKILEQIADFHNTIGDKMIPSQKPMMLVDALALSKLVQEQRVVSWNEEKSVGEYVDTLKTAVDKLYKDNNLLSSYHHQILQKINALRDTDVIKNYSAWKETQKLIAEILKQLENKGFRNMQSWKHDLDNHLAKILEYQYVRNLKTLHLYLPDIHADLLYRNSSLEFAPNEKELRVIYDQQLQMFMEIPKNFETLSENRDVFKNIIERNGEHLLGVSKQTDELFKQLEVVKNHWQSWLQLDSLDTSRLTSWQHWDLHFRASKTFGQEIAKLPSTAERVGCFLIGLSRLRSDLESHNRSYWDQLVSSLKKSITVDATNVQNFIDKSTSAMTKQPLNMEEVGETSLEFENIVKQSEKMEPIFKEVLKKSETLSKWCKEYIDTINVLEGAWNRLISLFENHHHIVAQQMESIKTKLNSDKENILKDLDRFSSKWDQVKFNSVSGTIASISVEDLEIYLTEFKKIIEEWNFMKTKIEKLRGDFEKFHIDNSDLELVDRIENNVSTEETYWSTFEEFMKEFDGLGHEPWLVTRKKIHTIEEFLKKWHKKLEEMEANQLVSRILQEILKYEAILPLLKYVKGEDFSDKHWYDTFNVLGMEAKPVDQLCVLDLLKVSKNIEVYSKELQAISKRAASEIIIRQALSDIDRWDLSYKFSLSSQIDSKGHNILIIKEFKDILNEIGDHQSLLQSMKNSTDYENFSERVNLWENKFTDLDYFLTALGKIQKKWLYLEPIFGSGTLTKEKFRFEKIDRDFRHIIAFIEKDMRVTALCRYSNLKSLLDGLLEQLGRCQITLENFLEEKRRKFPRFQFLSDDDLLEIVGQSSKEQILQTHISKLFSGISKINLSQDRQEINAMCSGDGEVIPLMSPISISKPIEEWLNTLVEQMQITLKALLVQRQNERDTPDPDKYPSQILCLAENVNFTTKCEQAITNMSLSSLLTNYKNQLNYYSSLEINNEADTFSSSKKTVLELKLKALMLDTIHYIAIIEELLKYKTVAMSDWIWQKQLRYYSNSTGGVTVKMGISVMEYSYEYLGNPAKLVRTPLTENCFLTLTQAIHLGMGGNPYGPAGTGKTESVKALGALLGRQVLVFNCDEGVDTKSMGRILTGLVETGAWGCFDEFNRLEEATLSAITMLLYPIQVALKTNREQLALFDKQIIINKHCGIFVTLNPAGGNYGGRNKLPDNLKQLFRPVVMTHPNNEQISKSLLLCDGFQNANIIAKKLVEVFDLASKLMDKHLHYDWGLRSIRTVLTECGRTLRSFKLKNKNIDLQKETDIIIQVLKNDTLPKLSYTDSLKFNALLEDVFGIAEVSITYNDPVKKYIEDSFQELDLWKNERQVTKCMEFYSQLRRRMGVAIVGPPRSGKTSIRNIVFNAIKKTNRQLKIHQFNPKCMSKTELFGRLTDSNQWVDGVLTSYSLQVVSEKDVLSWIVCDGDVDPEWVESLNSVLDDNRLLSLPSGWRIQFETNVNFVFETHELTHSSPATVSRIGIVFVSEEDLNLEQYIHCFCNKLPEEKKYILEPLINDYLLKAIYWVINEAEVNLPCSQLAIVDTVLSQLTEISNKADFAVAVTSSLAQQLKINYVESFIQQMTEWTGITVSLQFPISNYNGIPQNNDSEDIQSPNEQLPLINTGQINYYLQTLAVWLREANEQHFLIYGPSGSAKIYFTRGASLETPDVNYSKLIKRSKMDPWQKKRWKIMRLTASSPKRKPRSNKHIMLMLKKLVDSRPDLHMVTIHCTASLKPNFIKTKLLENCLTINGPKGKILKPIKGFLIIHFKNLQLLRPDKWGTNISIEFINQLIKYGGYYNSNIEFIGTENLILIGTLSSPINFPRFISQMRIFNVDLPRLEDFATIVSAHLAIIFDKYYPDRKLTKNTTEKLSSFIIDIFQKVKNIPQNKKHYLLSMNDTNELYRNLIRYRCDDISDFESFLIQVISYEALNIFGNKLVDISDRTHLQNIINSSGRTFWGGKYKDYKNDFVFVPNEQLSDKVSKLNKVSMDEWKDIVKMSINKCELDGQRLEIDVNKELLYLTAMIVKALSQRGGNILLIGKNGVGRKSAAKIISSFLCARLIKPESGEKQVFDNTMKTVLQYSGLEGEHVFLQVDDHLLKNSLILNSINSLISCGEIPNLYSTAELDSLVKALENQYHSESFEGNLSDYFFKRIKQNCHVIVYLDADNSDLWNMVQNCPSFIKDAHLVYMPNWSKDSIEATPRKLLDDMENEEIRKSSENTLPFFSKIHNVVKKDIATPSRFISLTQLYFRLYEENLNILRDRQHKLKQGVEKLAEAQDLVQELRKEAEEQQNILEEKQAKATASLNMISDTMKGANTQKDEMEILKIKIQEESVKLTERKKGIEIELFEVEPLIQEARSSVGNIKAESLSEIRSLRAPPEIIRDILEGVLRLMGIQDTSWNSMKTFLSKRGIKEEIRSFDANRIMVENRKAVEKLMMNKKESFDVKAAKRASAAAAPLAAWVSANVKYSYVLDKIRPLEIEQNKLKENLLKAEIQLKEVSSGLSDVDSTVDRLKQQLSDYTKEATEVEIKLNAAQNTLKSAEKLVAKLSDEYERWRQQLNDIFKAVDDLPQSCLLAAAFITYLSDETEEMRNELLVNWCIDLKIESFNFESFCSTERELLQWQSEGLPSDKISIQNTIIILKGRLIPFIVDPSCSASKWLKEHFKHKNIESIIQSSPKLKNQLEFAVRFGKTILIEEIDEICSVLYQIVNKEIIYQGERKLIQFNGKLIDYNDNFTPILCSRNENMQLPSSVLPLINVMNFSVTFSGLMEQLLNVAVCQKNPEFGGKRKKILKEREELEEKQDNIQHQLLNDLIDSTGNILSDEKLLESLNKTKESSTAITKALSESKELHNKLQTEYELFRNISNFGSSLYFACIKFAKNNSLYLLSIPAFTRLFLDSLQTFQAIGNSTDSQFKHLFSIVYRYMSRGIFDADRLKFALYLVHNVFSNEIPDTEWNTFIGKLIIGKNESDETPIWIPKHCTTACQNLQASSLDLYSKLELTDINLWKNFMNSNDPYNNIPSHVKLTSFQKVLIVQALRSDKLHTTLKQCIQSISGIFLEPPVLDLALVHKESNKTEPILILSTPGADPISQITELAERLGIKYIEVSLGSGQEISSIEAIKTCSETGSWLILKNLHLVTYWIPILTQNLKDISPNENFRLWLISEPIPNFHSVLAQNSMKVVFETSQGIKNNIIRTLSRYGKHYFEKLDGKSGRIFFAASCIHALLQERRKFIPQGWSKYYDFGDTDLSAAIKLTENFWTSGKSQVNWKSISGLFSDAVYGGKIEIMDDMKIIKTYVNQYFTDEILSHKWKPFDVSLNIPSSAQYQEYLNALKVLPKDDPPFIFGLPDNIERAWEQRIASKIISEIKNLDLIKDVSLKFNREKCQKDLTPFIMFWKKLNQGQEFLGIANEDIKNCSSAIKMFIKQEFNFALNLLHNIHQCFVALNKMCKDQTNPDEKYINIALSLLNHKTPKYWLDSWNGPKEPKQYLQTIMQKAYGLKQWKNEEIASLFSQPLNLSILFHPDIFLVSYKQDFSRAQKLPIDRLSLKTSWKPLVNSPLILKGLLIEGGILEDTLKPCSKNSDNITPAPNCYLQWILEEESNFDDTINVPFYATSDRNRIIAVLQIPGNKNDEAKWVQSGLAFYAEY